MNKKVLVTGGSGFIGRYILRALVEQGHTVVNYSIRPPGPQGTWWLKPVADQIVFVQGRINDWASVMTAVKHHRPDAIIHLAAVVNPVVLSQQPGVAFDTNLGGTFNVLEAARLFDVSRVINFSSIGVLPGIQYEPIDASHPIFTATEGPGASFYAAAKISGEAFCWAYHQSFALDFITIRSSAVYGFGQQYPIYIKPMIENAVQGVPTNFAQGREFPRDYTHVADVAQLAIRAVNTPAERVKDRVFYAATGLPLVTAGDVARIVKEFIPEAHIEIGNGLSDNDLIEIRYRGVLDIQNAKTQLGYLPQFANIRDGISDYIKNFRQYLTEKS